MVYHNSVLKRIFTGGLAVVGLAGAIMALDLSHYVPAQHDAIRNGVRLSYGNQAVGWALVLPPDKKPVTNVYDFCIYPSAGDQAAPLAVQPLAPYYYRYTGQGTTVFRSGPVDTLYFSYLIQDASRLDSAVITAGNASQIASLVNRVRIRADYVPEYPDGSGQLPQVSLFNDRNHDSRYDPGDVGLDRAGPQALAPGERLYALIRVLLPEAYRYAGADTVRLACSAERQSPSGAHLTKVVNRVISIQDRGLLHAAAEKSEGLKIKRIQLIY